jgi:hypothetical protein
MTTRPRLTRQARSPSAMRISSSRGQLSAVTVLSYRHYQTASFTHGGMAGTVGSRHCPLDQLSLARVPTIDPYLAGYTAFLQRMARRRRGRTT